VALALAVRSLRMDFGGVLAVDDVGFDVNEGEILGLIGPNGAGKTTFFNLVSGYLRPSRGSVSFFGRDVTGLPPYALARLGISHEVVVDAAAAGLFQSFVSAELIQKREKLLDRDERGEPIANHLRRGGQAE